jgi:serine protease
MHPVSIGPEANRIIVGFRATASNSVVQTVQPRNRSQNLRIVQAKTSSADIVSLAGRVGLTIARSRQVMPGMHVIFLQKTLYGADVLNTLNRLRADPAIEFADIDQLRYPQSVTPNDPLFYPTTGASGEWYMLTPQPTGDAAAVDAVSAWGITTGTTGTVIAVVDTGIRFDHPDIQRAGLGGKALPGYDFVGPDSSTGGTLSTFLTANDGDGWDPDPSDPGDWISATDEQSPLFPASACPVSNSSWHGTRVAGILGAITNNDAGIAGMTWSSWILPLRALGKCGGHDSDIIAAIEWAAGVSVSTAETRVPNNPYPANIINLSLGGSGSCPAAYKSALTTVTSLGALVVAAAGNSSEPTGTPANCSASVPGVLAVAGLRNVGTKVGYSSYGPEVGIAAPAGNCVNNTGACLKSIDTTTNLGTTVPSDNGYTNQINSTLGTSFSAPIVSGIAGLMHAVNGNLTPVQLITRLQAGATRFPANTSGLPVCPTLVASTAECSCAGSGQCGAGMANALGAVSAAIKPIAAVSFPPAFSASSSVTFDASGSAAACNRTLTSYAWTADRSVTISSGTTSAQVTASGTGTLTLVVSDSQGDTDTATITIGPTSATSTAPTTAGTNACPAAITVSPAAPTVTETILPTTVGVSNPATLTITLTNTNAYDLTQSTLTNTLPTSLMVATSTPPQTTCGGATLSLLASGGSLTLSNATIPANGTCTITVPVSSSTAGSYTNTIPTDALTTGPAGDNSVAASAPLTVTAPIAPGVSESFSPASVYTGSISALTITLTNTNAYALTQATLSATLPSNLAVATNATPTSTCSGSFSASGNALTMSGGTLPASGSCTLTVAVSSNIASPYTNTIAAGALKTAQNASNTSAASASLTVTAPNKGVGALDWLDLTVIAGAALVSGRRRMRSLAKLV